MQLHARIKTMFAGKRGLIAAGLLMLAFLGGFSYYKLSYLPSLQTASTSIGTAPAQLGDLVISVSGTGTLAAESADLYFKSDGLVAAMNVDVGDEVKAGDLLATLENNDVQTAYTEAYRAWLELTSPAAVASALEGEAAAAAEFASAR